MPAARRAAQGCLCRRACLAALGVVEEPLVAGRQAAQDVPRLVAAHAVPHAGPALLRGQVVHRVVARLALHQEQLPLGLALAVAADASIVLA